MTDTIYILRYSNGVDWVDHSYTRSIDEAAAWRYADPHQRYFTPLNEYCPDA